MGSGQCSHEDVAKRIEEKQPDIVCFSSVTFSIVGVYHIDKKIIFFKGNSLQFYLFLSIVYVISWLSN